MSDPAKTSGATAPADALRAFWNQRYGAADFVYGTAPNHFLTECCAGLPPGRALSLADGEGRNSVWLAQHGHAVTAVDIAEAGLVKARQLAAAREVPLETVCADIGAYDLGVAQWDLIVSIFCHLPPRLRRLVHRRAIAALRPGGLFVYEAYALGQAALGTGGPKEDALLPSLTDLRADFGPGDAPGDDLPACEITHAFTGRRLVVEGSLHTGEGLVNQLCIRRAG